jgi:hypothetical protein
MTEADLSAQPDQRPEFELKMSIPSDVRFAETVRELAVHAARHSGCSDADAQAFGAEVEDFIREHIETGASGTSVPLVFRRAAGPVEVLVQGRTLTP